MITKYTATDYDSLKIAENRDTVFRCIGRTTDKDGTVWLNWPNCGISFNFSGSGFIISMGEYNAETPAYIKVIVDNKDYKFAFSNGNERIVVESLPQRRHRVYVLRVTEGTLPIKLDSVTITGVNCKFMSAGIRKVRRLEFLGDSLTCGYGNLADISEKTFNTFQEDSTQTYAYFTGVAFRAETRTICLSGKGFVCNCEGNREDYKLSDIFKLDSFDGTKHSFNEWQPDVLVINGGTNDLWGGANAGDFIANAREFLLFVRSVYPNTKILWLDGMLCTYFAAELRELIRSLGGEKNGLYFMLADGASSLKGEIGGNGHPNVRANVRIAKALIKKLQSITDWKKSVSGIDEDDDVQE